MNKRFITFLSAGLMIFSLAACSGNTASTSSPSPTTSPTTTASAGAPMIGQVTAISGNTITLALGTQNMPQGGGPGGTSGDQPSPGSDAPADVSGNSGSNPAPSGSGQQPIGKDQAPNVEQPQGGRMGFTLTGETKTITVSSATIITVSGNGQETSGTLSDIAVDDILAVTISGDTVTAISVSSFGPTAPLGDATSTDAGSATLDKTA